MKPLKFLADSLKSLREFSVESRHNAGFELDKVQRGEQPEDFKPFPTIGPGVEELRLRDETGAYRVIYIARFADAVYVLHCFQKKTQKTAHTDVELARDRYKALVKMQERAKTEQRKDGKR